MKTIQLVQVNYQYGSNAYLPYSVGCLESSLRTNTELASHVVFRQPIFERHPISEQIKRIGSVDVLGLSCYIWNWEYSKALGRLYREHHPHALILVGGPQVPLHNRNLFTTDLDFADLAVVGEGEVAFSQVIENFVYGRSFKEIPGLLLPSGLLRSTVSTGEPIRIDDVASLPSPYTSGVFDQLISGYPELDFQVSQETHRGCPYSCTFCDWGSATMTRVRRLSANRILEEYEWMGVNKIELLYNCDANYGLFKEDLYLTEKLVETKKKYGYPKKFRAAYAKNSNDRVFEIARKLNDADMCKGVTLSLQSTDEEVLRLIKRKNMKINRFAELVETYKTARIPTYTELIIGLPGESLETFRAGLDDMLEAGQHNSLNIYHAMVLPNAELNDPSYRAAHQICSVQTPLLLLHGSAGGDEITEYNEIVVTTNTMTLEDWIQATILAFTIQSFHSLNLTQKIAIALRTQTGTPYSMFYEKLIGWALSSGNGPGQELNKVRKMCEAVASGTGSFDLQEKRFGNLIWPTEEALFLSLVLTDNRDWLRAFLEFEFGNQLNSIVIHDLVEYQHHATIRPFEDEEHFSLSTDIEELINRPLENSKYPLNQTKVGYRVLSRRKWNSLEEYAREVVWYGRKGTALENEISRN